MFASTLGFCIVVAVLFFCFANAGAFIAKDKDGEGKNGLVSFIVKALAFKEACDIVFGGNKKRGENKKVDRPNENIRANLGSGQN